MVDVETVGRLISFCENVLWNVVLFDVLLKRSDHGRKVNSSEGTVCRKHIVFISYFVYRRIIMNKYSMSAQRILSNQSSCLYVSCAKTGRRNKGGIYLLADEKYIYSAEIEVVVKWKSGKTVVRGMISSIKLQEGDELIRGWSFEICQCDNAMQSSP